MADTLDAFLGAYTRAKTEDEERYRRAKALLHEFALRFLPEIDAAAARMKDRLNVFGLRFLPGREVPRWHYPTLIGRRDDRARSFVVELFCAEEEDIIARVLFAVLGPDFEGVHPGIEILTSHDGVSTAHLSNQYTPEVIPLLVEHHMVTCVAPELRAQLGG